ncbi:MAG: DMT family transporter [Erysipelotrichaceae bacterium]
MNQKQANAVLLLVAIIWGSGFIAMKWVLDTGMQPFTLLFLRFGLASAMLGMALMGMQVKITKADLVPGVVLGGFLFLAFAFQTVGLQYTSVGNNAFLTAANVVMVPYFLYLFTKKKPGNDAVFAAILCMLGIALLSFDGTFTINVGDALTLVCAVFFALHIIFVQHFNKKEHHVLVLVFLQTLVAMVFSFICMLWEPRIGGITRSAAWGLLYLAVFSTTLCFFLQNLGQKYTEANTAAIIMASESLFGALFAVLLYQQGVDLQWILGCVAIFLAILLSEGVFRKET